MNSSLQKIPENIPPPLNVRDWDEDIRLQRFAEFQYKTTYSISLFLYSHFEYLPAITISASMKSVGVLHHSEVILLHWDWVVRACGLPCYHKNRKQKISPNYITHPSAAQTHSNINWQFGSNTTSQYRQRM